MTIEALREALRELTGGRDATFAFSGVGDQAGLLHVANAMLIPEEDDRMLKVTDGQSIAIIDAERVVWVRIGPPQLNK